MNRIENLWKLQEVEIMLENEEKMVKNKMNLREIHEKIKVHKGIKKEFETKKMAMEEAEKKLRMEEKERRELEYKREEIKKKLYDGKTNDLKQLDILIKEQEKVVGEIDNQDTKLLEMMESSEEMEREIKEMHAIERKMGSEINKLIKEGKANKAEGENKKIALKEEKEALLERISKKDLDIYMYIKNKKKSPVAIVQLDICIGCHMDLPTMTMSKLKKNEIVLCNNCGRILYNKSEE